MKGVCSLPAERRELGSGLEGGWVGDLAGQLFLLLRALVTCRQYSLFKSHYFVYVSVCECG